MIYDYVLEREVLDALNTAYRVIETSHRSRERDEKLEVIVGLQQAVTNDGVACLWAVAELVQKYGGVQLVQEMHAQNIRSRDRGRRFGLKAAEILTHKKEENAT